MSKSLRRVKAALAELGLEDTIAKPQAQQRRKWRQTRWVAKWIKLGNPSFSKSRIQIRLCYSSLREENR